MKEVIIIAALAKNNVIGNNGSIPWYIPEDFKRFKALTKNTIVIMGRKTWESLPEKFRPLPLRENIVISRNASFVATGAKVVSSLDDAITFAQSLVGEKIFLIGGRRVYEEGLRVADTLELTQVHASPDGDTLFPEVNKNEWDKVFVEDHDDFSFVTYKKKL